MAELLLMIPVVFVTVGYVEGNVLQQEAFHDGDETTADAAKKTVPPGTALLHHLPEAKLRYPQIPRQTLGYYL